METTIQEMMFWYDVHWLQERTAQGWRYLRKGRSTTPRRSHLASPPGLVSARADAY